MRLKTFYLEARLGSEANNRFFFTEYGFIIQSSLCPKAPPKKASRKPPLRPQEPNLLPLSAQWARSYLRNWEEKTQQQQQEYPPPSIPWASAPCVQAPMGSLRAVSCHKWVLIQGGRGGGVPGAFSCKYKMWRGVTNLVLINKMPGNHHSYGKPVFVGVA